jgi:hypothetical protein
MESNYTLINGVEEDEVQQAATTTIFTVSFTV